MDISDSLPNDNCSPVLVGDHPTSIPPHPNKDQQPVYAVVKKKKDPSKAKEETVKPRIAPKPARLQQGIMTDPPRSPINIPLIRISQTESVEKAEKNPPPSPPVVVKEVRIYFNNTLHLRSLASSRLICPLLQIRIL